MLQQIRAYLQSDLRILRWVLLALYAAIVLFLFIGFLLSDVQLFSLLVLGGMLLLQGLFVLSSGTMQLCRPITKRRLLLPVIVAGGMFSLLLLGLGIALTELFYLDRLKLNETAGYALLFGGPLLAWIIWSVIFYYRYREHPRFTVAAGLAKWMLAGSLLELLACVPSHIIVSRRPGCLVGLATMMGIAAGLCVMFFAFGPGIVLLFLRPRYRREVSSDNRFCDVCGYDLRASTARCPECGTAFRE